MNTHYCQGISQGYGNVALPLNEKHTEFSCDDIRNINNVSVIAEHIPAPPKRQLCPQVVCSVKCEGNCRQLKKPCSEEREKQPIRPERLQTQFVKQPEGKNFIPDWLGFDKLFSTYSHDIHETFEHCVLLEISILFSSLNL